MRYCRKLVEVALPLDAINTASAYEKSIRRGHRSTLHRWSARRPLAAARAARILRSLGFQPRNLEPEKVGCDIESRDPKGGPLRFIEVKDCAAGAETVTVTRNEILYFFNKPGQFILSIVEYLPGGEKRVHYVQRPFHRGPDPGAASVNYWFAELLAKATESR